MSKFMFPGVENYLKSFLGRDEVKFAKLLDYIDLGLTQRETKLLEELQLQEKLPLDMTTHIIIDYVASYVQKVCQYLNFSVWCLISATVSRQIILCRAWHLKFM
eukprot:GHVP01041528.1.p1 GENE.GHVP01041528.1~~GHVP01041528.1.p1  ORF type:complete len:104 (-),score=10.16 GHVP01041528.1:561-872(-)